MDKNDQLFMQLLYMFHTSAMQGLGKIADPTGQLNRNLEYVSQTIDLMAMLKQKAIYQKKWKKCWTACFQNYALIMWMKKVKPLKK